MKNVDYSKCYEICHSALNNRVPRKKRYICQNNKSFVTKPYSRAIIQRTRFRNKFLENATEENKLINKENILKLKLQKSFSNQLLIIILHLKKWESWALRKPFKGLIFQSKLWMKMNNFLLTKSILNLMKVFLHHSSLQVLYMQM